MQGLFTVFADDGTDHTFPVEMSCTPTGSVGTILINHQHRLVTTSPCAATFVQELIDTLAHGHLVRPDTSVPTDADLTYQILSETPYPGADLLLDNHG